jgi:ParB family chromosome partitioning protein
VDQAIIIDIGVSYKKCVRYAGYQIGGYFMNMFDEARSYRDMMSARGITQKKLAAFLGVSQPYVANKLRLLDYSEEVEKKILECGLSERHARTILRLTENKSRLLAIDKATKMNMNVARCEIMVDTMLAEKSINFGKCISYREQINTFENAIDSSIALLRQYGIRARSTLDEDEYNIYIQIKIEK